LKLSDDFTVTSELIRVTCLAKSHLMQEDSLNSEKKPQKSPFMMKMKKEEPDETKS